MATVQDFTSGARQILRDFPLFFEVDTGVLNTLSVRLPHPLINGDSLGVYLYDTSVPPNAGPTTLTDKWQLDARNGVLKITDTSALNKVLLVNGYHYSWFLDSDLAFHASQVWGEMSYYDDLSLSSLQPAQAEVVEYGIVVHALWSLLIELSLDIDVYTPEGMNIPARQRYTQVWQMLQAFEAEYQSKASLMNMGLGALSQFDLRRIALMTGRYVPVYVNREFDDPRPPTRVYPPIPSGAPDDTEVQVSTWDTNTSLVGNMPPGLTP
jgi:hypothetical protein